MTTPGGGRNKQPGTPSSSNEPRTPIQKAPLTREPSVIQEISNFMGIRYADQEVIKENNKWNKKRLRYLDSKYGLNSNEVQKFKPTVRNQSLNLGTDSSSITGVNTASVLTPGTPEEGDRYVRGTIRDRGLVRTMTQTSHARPIIGHTPSLPANYESTSSFEQQQRGRSDSFSQTVDLSTSQTRLSKSRQDRDSITSAVFSSVASIFKRGSLVNKNKMKLKNSMSMKCSFDLDMISSTQLETPELSTPSEPALNSSESPIGITFSTTAPSDVIEMTVIGKPAELTDSKKKRDRPVPPSPKAKRDSPEIDPMARLRGSQIPEETSFEVEAAEMGDVDEAQTGELDSLTDENAISRMTAKVRKKSSVRIPPAIFSTIKREPIQQSKTELKPERPSDLLEGTRPLMHPSSSLPSGRDRMKSFRSSSSRSRAKKSTQSESDLVLDLLADITEATDHPETTQKEKQQDEEDGEQDEEDELNRRPFLAGRTFSLVDEVFFDTPSRQMIPLDPPLSGPARMPPPELDSYHPDIAQSPPTSAALNAVQQPYSFDPETIVTADIDQQPSTSGTSWLRQVDGISYIDVGDAHIVRPGKTALGGPSAVVLSKTTDRPKSLSIEHTTSPRRPLIRQSTVESSVENQPMWTTQKIKLQEMQKQATAVAKKLREKQSKRQRGMDAIGSFFGRELKRKEEIPKELRDIMNEEEDERPWFTYWISIVHIIICVLSLILFPKSAFGIRTVEKRGEVEDVTNSIRSVSYHEIENLWFGPRYSDLIHLGAKYSPCMRVQHGLWNVIEEDRRIENKTGCCIVNDKSGCYQSSENLCPRNVAHWVRWDKKEPRKPLERKSKSDSDLLKNTKIALLHPKRISGAVCGQDPEYCELPSSVAPHIWPDDLTEWPICQQRHEGAGLPEHMTCRITGRPCCIQLQGLCRIATKEYCDFVNGYYHENATLCSQVNCFRDVCGMLPFFGDTPDQFYRLFISIFIHAGVLHLVISIFFQMIVMRDLERLIGAKRMMILYFVSGIGGNLASAIFVPYNPEVGPSGSQFGVLAALVVDTYHHRRMIQQVNYAYAQHLFFIVSLTLLGLLPWVDNWAHTFGFICGLLTTIIIFPYLDFPDEKEEDEQTYMIRDALSSSSALGTPLDTTGYNQMALPSPDQPALFFTLDTVWKNMRAIAEKKVGRRRFYVILAAIILILLYSLMLFVFFGNIEINCPWCIHFNCFPTFDCDNQGQKLKKWLPI